MAASPPPDWLRLQRKIFTRWVNQKLKKQGIELKDVVTDLVTGLPLIHLIEVLSETTFTDKIDAHPKMRVQEIDNCRRALDFTWKAGVEMKLKPSAENIVDQVEKEVLSLIWAIMIKFMKFGDEDDDGPQTKFSDALQMWIANQVNGYPEVKVENMTKSFHSGLALCALIHKFRPKLLDYHSLRKDDSEQAFKVAFAAAEKYFGLEQYLAPSDIPKLDDKSMVVYLSEYYYGIAEARKVDLAARRIQKLVAFTKANDALRAEYKDGSDKLHALFEKVFKVLGDRTIDNNMAGAKKRLAEFYDFKSSDKGLIYSTFYGLENVFQNLSRRLAHHKRPEYKTEAGRSIPELRASLESMEKQEKERNVTLHDELNRQLKLAKIYEVYTKKYTSVKAWIHEKKVYLSTKQEILSVGAAQFALNTLSAYNEEAKALTTESVTQMISEAKELLDNKFEHSSIVTERETEIAAGLTELSELAGQKRLVHEDDLAREIFKAKVNGWAVDHGNQFSKLQIFAVEKIAYLQKKEDVKSIAEGTLQLHLLSSYVTEKEAITPNIEPFNKLGAEILSAKYETKLSCWEFPTAAQIKSKEESVKQWWEEQHKFYTHKLAILEDDLARETYKDKIYQANHQHKDKHQTLKRFIEESTAYLEKKEPVNSIPEAQLNLSVLRTYHASQKQEAEVNVVTLTKLGHDILTAAYKSDHSSWHFETPDEVKDREAYVHSSFEALGKLEHSKQEVLHDDLLREEFKAKLRLWNSQHTDKFNQLKAWFLTEEKYLEKKDDVNSVADADQNLKVFVAHEADKVDVTKLTRSAAHKLAHAILTEEYKTKHSEWKWETPEEVKERETFLDHSWATLDKLAHAKKAILDADLKREIRKEEVRVEFAKLAGEFARFSKDTVSAAPTTLFGFVLEEVEAFQKVLEQKDAQVSKRASDSKAAYTKIHTELTELNVTENPYTHLTLTDLETAQTNLATAVQTRLDAYNVELAKQRHDDKLCQDLAAVVDPWLKNLVTNKALVAEAKSDSKEGLEAQIAKVNSLIEEAKADTNLAKIKGIQAQITAAGILYNRHTLNNALDAEVTWTQYVLFLNTKGTALAEELDHLVMRGITREQYEEIKIQWTQFDKNKNGVLDRSEFKACLYSLGEERGKKEVIEIMEKYGTGKGKEVKIEYDGFKEFMIQQLGDSDTKEEIVGGFKLINRHAEKVELNEELAHLVLEESDVAFVKSTHPGLHFIEWAESVFSR